MINEPMVLSENLVMPHITIYIKMQVLIRNNVTLNHMFLALYAIFIYKTF